MKALVSLIFLCCSIQCFSFSFQKGTSLKDSEYIFNLSGSQGLVLCFHGHEGSAQGWLQDREKRRYLEDLQKKGFSFLCPTSLNRDEKKWDASPDIFNKDIRHINSLLKDLGVSRKEKIYLVGHSNGGGFASYYSIYSLRSAQIKGIQYSGSRGIDQILADSSYTFKTLFALAKCDPNIDSNDVEDNAELLKYRLGKNKVEVKQTDFLIRLRRLESCHKFVNISKTFLDFF